MIVADQSANAAFSHSFDLGSEFSIASLSMGSAHCRYSDNCLMHLGTSVMSATWQCFNRRAGKLLRCDRVASSLPRSKPQGVGSEGDNRRHDDQ